MEYKPKETRVNFVLEVTKNETGGKTCFYSSNEAEVLDSYLNYKDDDRYYATVTKVTTIKEVIQ